MNKITTFIGLDVHKDSISIATLHRDAAEPEFLGVIPNEPNAIRSLIKKLGNPKTQSYCYEAGPCGYVLYRQLVQLGASCMVVAPSLVPVKPGDRVKTDRRDAIKLVRLLRNGDLTSVHVPNEKQEALRDLLRARENSNDELLRLRNQLTKFLLRLGIKKPASMKTWSRAYHGWLDTVTLEETVHQFVLTEFIHSVRQTEEKLQRFDQIIEESAMRLANPKLFKALQSMRGIGLITAAVLVAELGDITRFTSAKHLMAYVGLIPGERSSGNTRKQGGITKTGNSHVRYAIVESSWHYRHKPRIGPQLNRRQKNLSKEVRDIAWKAQLRLHHKYRKMLARGKSKQITVIAISRELVGFVWAIAHQIAVEEHMAA
jgi:transposase